MAIRFLALDLDGTLLNQRGEISARNHEAVAAARKKGVRVAVVTGRRFRDARPLALELKLDDVPLISHNGALTKHAETLETVNATLLPLAEAHKVIATGREMNVEALVSVDSDGAGTLLYEREPRENDPLAKYIAWARRIHGDEADDAVHQVASLEEHLRTPPVHISFSGTCAAMQKVRMRLAETVGSRVKVYATIYPKLDFTLLDILHPEVSKAVGVAAAAKEYGIAQNEVMAIGDNHNDLEMLHYAGVGVVMENAEAEVRNIAEFHRTAGNTEDGVAQAIEKFILNGNHS